MRPRRKFNETAFATVLLLLFLMIAVGCAKGSGTSGAQEAPGPVTAPSGDAPADPAATPDGASNVAADPASTPAGDAAKPPTGEGEALMDCDHSKVRCKRIAPICPEGEAASVAGSCFGPCVAIQRCACNETTKCPNPDKHACWSNQHCGPYVR